MPKGYCKVPNCDTFGNKDVRLVYNLPTPIGVKKTQLTHSAELRLRRRKLWLSAVGHPEEPTEGENLVICSRHFVSGKPAAVGDTSSVDWVPTLFLPGDGGQGVLEDIGQGGSGTVLIDSETDGKGPSTNDDTDGEDAVAVGERICDGSPAEMFLEPCLNGCAEDKDDKSQVADKYKELQKQYLLLQAQWQERDKLFEALQEEHRLLLGRLRQAESTVQHTKICEDSFAGDDEKTLYFTGLASYDVLMLMFNHVKDHIRVTNRSALNSFQQYILSLMRLRLNLDFKLLGFIFNVSESTACRVFHAVIHVLYVRYEFLVSWPTRENLIKSMPLEFREMFGCKVAVIIDCFEVHMERPSNIHAAAQVYSQYKSHTTAKFLIGMCPQGAITFVSRGYGGRASDKHITETSEFVLNLLPGDVVLADRGFTVHDIVREQRAEIHMPAFKKKGDLQLHPRDVERSRRVSNLRIHIERIIGTLKSRFKVWSCKLPIEVFHADNDGVPIIDKMMRVTCALSNVNPTITTMV